MSLVLVAFIVGGLILTIVFLRRLSCSPAWRLRRLASGLNTLLRQKHRDKEQVAYMLKGIYGYTRDCITSRNFAGVYQSVDLLKLAYGNGLVHRDDPLRLMALVVAALKTGQSDAANTVLDAFRPLIRHLSVEDIPVVAQQLTIIGVVSLKEKQNFLLPKIAEYVFIILGAQEWRNHSLIMGSALGALKVVGLLALRQNDLPFVREIGIKLVMWHGLDKNSELSVEILSVLTSWLHHIVKNNNAAMFATLSEILQVLLENKVPPDDVVELIITEWEQLAGTACLNPECSLATLLCDQMLAIAGKGQKMQQLCRAVSAVARVASLALGRYGVGEGFPVAYPLLETGRKLLVAELKAGGNGYDSPFRQHALYYILKESLMLVELSARQNMEKTPGEIIVELFERWIIGLPEYVNKKSVKKYCQLLLLYWMQTRRKQAKRSLPVSPVLTEPALLSPEDRRILGL